MEPDLRDYVVSFVCDDDDYDCYHHVHFVTEYPVNSVGFWDDFYDVVFNLFVCPSSFNLRITEIAEGF